MADLEEKEVNNASLSQLAVNPIKVCMQDVRKAVISGKIKLEESKRRTPWTLSLLEVFLVHRPQQEDNKLLDDDDLFQLAEILIQADNDPDITICFANLRNLFKFERLSALRLSCKSVDDFKVICGVDYRYAECAAMLRSTRVIQWGDNTFLAGMDKYDYYYRSFRGHLIDENRLRSIVNQKIKYPSQVLKWCDENFKEYMDFVIVCPVERHVDFFDAFGNLLLADICTPENKKYILENLDDAVNVTYEFYRLKKYNLYNPENREVILDDVENAKRITDALIWLARRGIYNEKNRATVLNDLPVMDYLLKVGKNKLSLENQDPDLNQKLFDETVKHAKQKRLCIWKIVEEDGQELKAESEEALRITVPTI